MAKWSRKKKVQITLAVSGVAIGTALVLLFPRIKKFFQQPSLKLPTAAKRSIESGGKKVIRFDDSGDMVLNYDS